MSHGITRPPSLATRALHGAPCMNASRPLLPLCARRAMATIVHPFFSSMVKQTLLIAGACVVFLGGIFIGHFATSTIRPGTGRWLDKPVDAVVLEKFRSELHLTPAQTARLAPVIAAACADLRILSEERHAQRLELLDEIAASIAPELNPDQQRRLEALEAERQNRPPAKRDQRIVALF